ATEQARVDLDVVEGNVDEGPGDALHRGTLRILALAPLLHHEQGVGRVEKGLAVSTERAPRIGGCGLVGASHTALTLDQLFARLPARRRIVAPLPDFRVEAGRQRTPVVVLLASRRDEDLPLALEERFGLVERRQRNSLDRWQDQRVIAGFFLEDRLELLPES